MQANYIKTITLSGMKNTILFLLTLLFACSSCKQGKTYYIDSESGSDTHNGTSPQTAWKTLDPANERSFLPNEKLLLKAGSIFYGQLEPKGSGEKNAPIIIDMYGEGKKPIIHGEGKKNHTLLLENIAYWEVNNLEITNKGGQDTLKRRGVLVRAFNMGDCNHIYLNKLTVHDINGSLFKHKGGGTGIYWQNGGDSIPTRFIGLQIENCHIYNCQRDGITSWGNTDRSKWHPSLNVIVRHNLIEKVPGDAIVPIGCDGALIEHNLVRNSPDLLHIDDAAAGIWPWSSDNTTIQYNEVCGQSAKWDGQGFDSDYNCLNTLIQYNYSHDNAGGFILICNEGNSLGKGYNIGTENTIVRYNISVNDGLRTYPTRPGWFSPTIHISGPAKNTKIYNNIFIIKEKSMPEIDKTILKVDNWGGPWPENVLFANNIFCIEGDTTAYKFDMGAGIDFRFTNNLFYGNFSNQPDDIHAILGDPKFKALPLSHTKDEILEILQLQPSSPCIDKGTYIENNGNKDFWGNSIDSSHVHIGAFGGNAK